MQFKTEQDKMVSVQVYLPKYMSFKPFEGVIFFFTNEHIYLLIV